MQNKISNKELYTITQQRRVSSVQNLLKRGHLVNENNLLQNMQIPEMKKVIIHNVKKYSIKPLIQGFVNGVGYTLGIYLFDKLFGLLNKLTNK